MSASHSGRITRIITTDFPQYFAIITRIKQEVHVIGAEGGILISSVASHVQAVFPAGALTKKIKVGLQASKWFELIVASTRDRATRKSGDERETWFPTSLGARYSRWAHGQITRQLRRRVAGDHDRAQKTKVP